MDASGSIIVAKQGNEVAMRLRSGAAHAAESFGTLSQVARIEIHFICLDGSGLFAT